jgi:preprotein translocase subunit SecA
MMSSYDADVSVSKLSKLDADEIREMVTAAACRQVDNKDGSMLAEFLSDGYGENTFVDVLNTRFDLKLTVEQIKDRGIDDIHNEIVSLISAKYDAKEIEYPVDFALGMVFTRQGVNTYGLEMLSKWAKSRYDLDISPEQMQQTQPSELREKLIEAARHTFANFEQEIREKAQKHSPSEFTVWMEERYHIRFADELTDDMEKLTENSVKLVRGLLRNELSKLEKYVLLQIYDSAWKDHLYAMDRLKESIFLRSFAEKDPKIEYKREGYKMFQEMLSSVRQRVTDTIFKVRLSADENTKNVYSGQSESHDAAKQFARNETQRAAAMAPQRSGHAAPIVNKDPKIGRNDPCPCGSGKKYKKCCGK